MSAQIKVRQDENGRLSQVELSRKGEKPLKVRYFYVQNGLSMQIEGKKDLIPSYAELLSIIDAKFKELTYNPEIFMINVVPAALGTTGIWLPPTGKRFRILGGFVIMGGEIVAPATRILLLQESVPGSSSINILGFNFTIPVAASNIYFPFDLRPDGYLATGPSPHQVQASTQGGVYTTGQDFVSVWGREE